MSMNTEIYQDISTRTAGDIYIGVVGPVRAGKSTFIKRFMETQVIPNIDNVYRRERAKDELPQSGSGRMVMTAEPKFVPEEAVDIALDEGSSCSVRLIDCVGYMIPGATGQMEGESPRMVSTPWLDHEVTMSEAAELGTTRVIREHSTIGVVVTTDGSITDIPREDYIEAEGRVIRELQEIGKPFLVLLNATEPESDRVQAMARDIASRYGVTCLPVNCLTLDDNAVGMILKAILYGVPALRAGPLHPAVGRGACRRSPDQKRPLSGHPREHRQPPLYPRGAGRDQRHRRLRKRQQRAHHVHSARHGRRRGGIAAPARTVLPDAERAVGLRCEG